MTIQPMATAVPVPAVPAGAGEAAAPTDFLAALLAALAPADVAASDPELGEVPQPRDLAAPETEIALPDVVAQDVAALVAAPAVAALVVQQAPIVAPRPGNRLVEEGAPAPVSKPGATPAVPATPATPAAPATPATPAPGFETVAAQPPQPAEQLSERSSPELAVAGRTAPKQETAPVPTEAPTSVDGVPNLPATANQPAAAPNAPVTSIAGPVPAAAPTTAASPVANTAPLDRISAQVFGEITGLVSRGNGTHRITMTLNPEALGEVRVVMTMRDGAVHVRMAAGHEASAALLDGSSELSRLLETAGATETRIVVRDLPAAAVSSTHSSSHSTLLGGDSTPDQHAGTRADHQARDGSDHTTPRPARVEGTTSPGLAPRSIQPVSDSRLAGVDLTM